MAHIGPRHMKHKGRIIAIGLGQANLIRRNIRINPRISSRLGGIRRIIHLNHFLLFSYSLLLLVTFFITDHLQVLDLGLGGWGQTVLHALAGGLEGCGEVAVLVVVFYYVGLAH